jgi:hypothetical protein
VGQVGRVGLVGRVGQAGFAEAHLKVRDYDYSSRDFL